jgi:hypothetical protein
MENRILRYPALPLAQSSCIAFLEPPYRPISDVVGCHSIDDSFSADGYGTGRSPDQVHVGATIYRQCHEGLLRSRISEYNSLARQLGAIAKK